jgi:2-polyprenyl-3-methyl-5-hydroxy-6-metoxy-1,4-benzoquinol methylase
MFKKALKKRQKMDSLKKHFPDLQGKRCLLITCGDNNGAMNYHIRQWGGSWVWAELEASNLHVIKELLEEPVVQLDPRTGQLPFLTASFDCVLTIDCHEHLTNPATLNEELWRITKPGGKIVVTVPNGNRRKLAVRIKEMVGMTPKTYGHLVIGYEIPALQKMLEDAGFKSHATASYSKFFTEMIELGINVLYVKILAKRHKVIAAEGTIAPTTKEQLNSISKSYKLYNLIYPLLWGVSQLDRLLFFITGYAVIVEARKS